MINGIGLEYVVIGFSGATALGIFSSVQLLPQRILNKWNGFLDG